jgi:hypothetical protein
MICECAPAMRLEPATVTPNARPGRWGSFRNVSWVNRQILVAAIPADNLEAGDFREVVSEIPVPAPGHAPRDRGTPPPASSR